MNEINLDKIEIHMPTNHVPAKPDQPTVMTQTEDITVTNNLNNLIQLIHSEDMAEAAPNQSRVMAMMHQMENHEYKIDLDQLAEKLLTSGLLTTRGN